MCAVLDLSREQAAEAALALIPAVAIGAGIAYVTREPVVSLKADAQTSVAPAASSRSTVSTCREAGIDRASTRELTCRTSTAMLTMVNGSHLIEMPGARVRVRSAKAFLAATPAGRARNRMRLELAVELRASTLADGFGGRSDDAAYVTIGGARVAADPRDRGPGVFALDTPVQAGQTRSGRLRFELAGTQTKRLLDQGGQFAIRPFDAEPGKPVRIGVSRLRPPTPRELPATPR